MFWVQNFCGSSLHFFPISIWPSGLASMFLLPKSLINSGLWYLHSCSVKVAGDVTVLEGFLYRSQTVCNWLLFFHLARQNCRIGYALFTAVNRQLSGLYIFFFLTTNEVNRWNAWIKPRVEMRSYELFKQSMLQGTTWSICLLEE